MIELLVVIAIIGLLATLAVVALNNARARARDAKRVADIKQIQTALELYFNDNNTYPVNSPEADISGSTTLMPTYMATVPSTPDPADGSCTTTNNQYIYESTAANGTACTSSPCADYELQFCLGATTGGLSAGENCATSAGITSGACDFTN